MKESSIFESNLNKTFLKLAIPSIAGMLFISMQVMIDGLFIGNYVGSNGLAAINLIMPFTDFIMSFVLMIGIGGSVLTSILKGSGNHRKYLESFSFVFYLFLIFSILVTLISMIFKDKIIVFLGADAGLFSLVDGYLSFFIPLSFFFNLPIFLETYTRIAEKPNLIFISSFMCFVANIIFDYIFLDKFHMGMEGAAMATCIANGLGGLLLYVKMIGKNKAFSFVKTSFDFNVFKNVMYNGSSEMFSTLSASITTFIFNVILMKNIGQTGVAAFTVILYTNSIIRITLYGLAQALQPIISYNLGARNIKSIYKVLKTALISGGIISLVSFSTMAFYGKSIIALFIKDNLDLELFTSNASNYYILSYIFLFINIIIGTYHTSIEKAFESVAIAILHSFVLVVFFLYILPLYMGEKGIWLAVPFAEATTVFFSVYFLKRSSYSLQSFKNKAISQG